MTRDVDEKIGGLSPVEQLRGCHAEDLRTVVVDQRRRAGQAELLGDLLEVPEGDAVGEGRDPTRSISTRAPVDLLHQVGPEAEPLEAEGPAEAHPALSAVKALISDRAADDDRCH